MTREQVGTRLNGWMQQRVVPWLLQLDMGAIALVLILKVLVIGFGAIAYQIWMDQPFASWQQGLAIWNQWDAPHYIDIARNGYQATGEQRYWLAFYPLFPALVSVLARFNGDYVLSGFLVSAVASVAAALLLKALIRLDEPGAIAQSAVWFLLIFPTSYFLHIGYTESLFLALTLGCFLAARHQKWWLAGCLGALASMTRVSGLVLMPALLLDVWVQYRQTPRWQWSWLWVALVPAGFGIYLLCNFYVTGHPLTFLTYQREYWHKFLTFPWVGIQDKLMRMTNIYTPWKVHMVAVQELLFMGLGLVATVWSWFKLRPSYTAWMVGNWLLFTSTSHILSVPRYTLVMFPLFWLFARLARYAAAYSALTVWSLLFLALFASLFVQGRWAF